MSNLFFVVVYLKWFKICVFNVYVIGSENYQTNNFHPIKNPANKLYNLMSNDEEKKSANENHRMGHIWFVFTKIIYSYRDSI